MFVWSKTNGETETETERERERARRMLGARSQIQKPRKGKPSTCSAMLQKMEKDCHTRLPSTRAMWSTFLVILIKDVQLLGFGFIAFIAEDGGTSLPHQAHRTNTESGTKTRQAILCLQAPDTPQPRTPRRSTNTSVPVQESRYSAP